MKKGRHTFIPSEDIFILSTCAIAGPNEGRGRFGSYYDAVLEDPDWDCKTHEKTEIKMHKFAIEKAIEKSKKAREEVDCLIGGDLLNQLVASTFAAREFEIPCLGVYSACASFGEALAIASFLIGGQNMKNVLCCTGSHYGAVERQFRYPLELGTQPAPSSQYTVTAAGAALLSTEGEGQPRITGCTIGKIVDYRTCDANNMGAARAPAAADTIVTHLQDTGRRENYYDYIFTGDLGKYGTETLYHLCKERGLDLSSCLNDCGALIYSEKQKDMQGGSGAGCLAAVFCSYIYKEMKEGNMKRVLLVPTGALLSKGSSLQGESIPGIAHAVSVEA